jgi:hypothetical protein
MNLDDFLTQLQEKSGISPLQFSDEGVVSFIFNGEFTVSIEKSDNDSLLTIHAKIGELPTENQGSCMKALLEANLFGQKTAGASIGLDAGTNEVYLFRSFALHTMEFDYFFDALTSFMQAQQQWTIALRNTSVLPEQGKTVEPKLYL